MLHAPAFTTPPPPLMSGASRRRVALGLLVAHAALVIVWLQSPPARRALASVAPVVVSLLPAQRPMPAPAAEPALARPLPAPPRMPLLPPPDISPPQAMPHDAAPPPTPALAAAAVMSVTSVPATPSATPPPPNPSPPAAAPAAPEPPPTVAISAVRYLVPPVLDYPVASRRQGEEGLVQLRVLIGADGVPREFELIRSSGHRRLDEAALSAARATRFRPYLENGQPRAAWVVMPLQFELQT